MNIPDQIFVVTGAARGLGRELVDELLDRGVTRVYAAARNPGAVRADERAFLNGTLRETAGFDHVQAVVVPT